jgi:exodeoxyribonuclease-3
MGLAPDIALLQEVSNIPQHVHSLYTCDNVPATGKTGKQQKFGTAILVKGDIEGALPLPTPLDWVAKELSNFTGNLVARQLKLSNGNSLKVISVYCPAWPVNRERLLGIDTDGVRLTLHPDVWVGDLLWTSLKHLQLEPSEAWIIGGDFNLSETFDLWRGGPRGNREYLDRMAELGLVESLRYSKGALTPTFRNTSNNLIKHQMDHLFITKTLAQSLIGCETGSQEQVFGAGLSDHLPIIADFHLQ